MPLFCPFTMKSRQGIGQQYLITFLFCMFVIFIEGFRKNSGSPWKHLPTHPPTPKNEKLNRTKTNSIFKTDRLFGLPYRQYFNYITAANSKKRLIDWLIDWKYSVFKPYIQKQSCGWHYWLKQRGGLWLSLLASLCMVLQQ